MSIHRTKLDKKCPTCNSDMIEIHVKNPYIDDFGQTCSNPECDEYIDVVGQMNRFANSIARSEEE